MDFFGTGDRLGDFLAQKLAVSPPQAMHGRLDIRR